VSAAHGMINKDACMKKMSASLNLAATPSEWSWPFLLAFKSFNHELHNSIS